MKKQHKLQHEQLLRDILVLSTLHTNDAPSTITRLIDMGIEPYLLASSIVGVVAQRLVRKICPNCKVSLKQQNTKGTFTSFRYVSTDFITLR